MINDEKMIWSDTIFHVHTYRCRHASEEKEIEYIEKAIELGKKEIVFTDHAPFPINPFRFRMSMYNLQEYVAVLLGLKSYFSDIIDVKIGLEVEFFPRYMDYYEYLKASNYFDLLVLGQHFSQLPDGGYTYDLKDKSQEHRNLADGIIDGIKSGLFQVVAHPDQIFRRIKEWNAETEEIAWEIKNCAAESGVILEKNVRNMIGRKKKKAFRQEFWQELPEGLQIVYGTDAHSVAEMEEADAFLYNWRHT